MATANQTDLLNTFAAYGAMIEKTSAMLEEKKAQDNKIAALVPQAVESLLANERIEPGQKEAAALALQDPVRALEILIKVAYHRNQTEKAKIGSPVAPRQKTASASNSLTSSYVGDRRPGKLKESDLAMMSRLNITPQAE